MSRIMEIQIDFYRHEETKTLLMSEVKKLGCRRFIKRFCKRLGIRRRDAFSLIRGIRDERANDR